MLPIGWLWAAGVYPRGRGEARALARVLLAVEGLSPRARGSLERGDHGKVSDGSIPAGAGKPDLGRRDRIRSGVYPRGRGEAADVTVTSSPSSGLSPRARGSPDGGVCAGGRRGSIPAGAGKPHSNRHLPSPNRVYPRGRGEALNSAEEHSHRTGLSPRARGSRLSAEPRQDEIGSIPAGAGKPRARARDTP